MGIPLTIIFMAGLGISLVTAYTLAPSSIKETINKFFELEESQ